MKSTFAIKTLLTSWLACTLGLVLAQNGASISFEQVISLRSVGTPILSPDGKQIVYTIGSTDWKDNSYDTEIWLTRVGEAP